MPNYVRNILQINASPDKVKEILKAIQSDSEPDNPLDFNKIIPMPKSLEIEAGSQEDLVSLYMTYINPKIDYYGFTDCKNELPVIKQNPFIPAYRNDLSKEEIEKMLQRFNRFTEEQCLSIGKQYYDNFCQYGATSWYHWCCSEWGTKWRACDAYLASDDMIVFDTAWNHPEPIIIELSKKFNVNLRLAYADEDFGGGNHGFIEVENGRLIHDWHPEDFEECVSFTNDVWENEHIIKELDVPGHTQEMMFS